MTFLDFGIEERKSFIDYLKAGLSFQLSIAIDFTSLDGHQNSTEA